MNEKIIAITAAISGFAAAHLGGWSGQLVTLGILMAFDYVCGITIPLLWGKSKKSKGKVESRESLKGLFKKSLMMGMVFVFHRLDLIIGGNYLTSGLVLALIVNEVISIIEHARIVGITIPFLDKALLLLREKLNTDNNNNNNN